MLFLPECFGFLGSSSKQTLENAENLQDDNSSPSDEWISKTLREIVKTGTWEKDTRQQQQQREEVSILKGLRVIAQSSGLWISGGGIHEAGAPPKSGQEEESITTPRVYNTHIILDNQGTLVCRYRKIHLFDVSIPDQNVHLQESATTAPGSEIVVCDSPIGKRFCWSCCLSSPFFVLVLSNLHCLFS